MEARVTYLNGTPITGGFTAQLFGGAEGTPVSALTPLFPTTIFRSAPLAGYIIPKDVIVPGIPGGNRATLVMRAFSGSSWENSSCRGESNPITIVLYGGFTGPASTLIGLQPFSVDCIPEPSSIALVACGAVAMTLARSFPFRSKARR